MPDWTNVLLPGANYLYEQRKEFRRGIFSRESGDPRAYKGQGYNAPGPVPYESSICFLPDAAKFEVIKGAVNANEGATAVEAGIVIIKAATIAEDHVCLYTASDHGRSYHKRSYSQNQEYASHYVTSCFFATTGELLLRRPYLARGRS